MRSLITAAAIATLSAITAGPALAQPFIEIEWEGTAHDHSGVPQKRFGGRAVFDAAAPPVFTGNMFEAVETERYSEDASADPGVEPPTNSLHPGFLVYIPADGSIIIDVGSHTVLSISPTTSDFMPGMDSLPDDPASYAFAGGASDGVFVESNVWGVYWSPGSGHSGGTFRYWVREVENPNPPAPCIADADGNGILDLSDVNIFAATFVAGCP